MGSESLLSETLSNGGNKAITNSTTSHDLKSIVNSTHPKHTEEAYSVVRSSSRNQSKENNLDEYYHPHVVKSPHFPSRGSSSVVTDYERDEETSTSSNFTHLSKESQGLGMNMGMSISLGGGSGLTRSKSRIIFSSAEKFQSHQDLKAYYEKEEELEQRQRQQQQQQQHEHPLLPSNELSVGTQLPRLEPTKFFGRDIRTWTNGSSEEPNFDEHLRHFMDTHIAKARKKREEKYISTMQKMGIDVQSLHRHNHNTISSNSYVPYPGLRHERRFLYDVETYPLHTHLADILGVSDLSLIHTHPIQDKKKLMKPLLDPKKRLPFHQCYDNFVTSFCIPLLHSLAMGGNLFNDQHQRKNKISYRYQAFPCIRVNRPGEFSIGPHCDMAYGHSMGNINFHIPLTPTKGTNALYTESHPGREDWHPLKTKSIGLGYSFDGARNLHFTLENTTDQSRVSIDFRIAIHRETRKEIPRSIAKESIKMMMDYSEMMRGAIGEEEDERCNDIHDVLCHKKMLQDNYSSFPGYYEEAYVELGTPSSTKSGTVGFGPGPVVCKRNTTLMHPDRRVGFPF